MDNRTRAKQILDGGGRLPSGDRIRAGTTPVSPPPAIRRVAAQRILPDGFHSIRHYGLFANGRRVENIAHVRQLLNVPAPHNEGGGADCAGDGEPQTLAYPCPG
jgi:hypothetical protein